MNVRYTLEPNSILHTKTDKIVVETPCFVDLLEPMECEGIGKHIKVRVFLPDGTIMNGTVSGPQIKLANKDFLFDGRFNSTQA